MAGSADAFRKVDLDYVAASARAASAGGVPHFSLVSAQGARAGVWASDLKLFHGLLYMKVKGQVGGCTLRGGWQGGTAAIGWGGRRCIGVGLCGLNETEVCSHTAALWSITILCSASSKLVR